MDAAPLSPFEEHVWGRVVMATALIPAAIEDRLKGATSLTHFQFSILAALSRAPDNAVLMSDVARHANASLSRLSHAVSKLEAAGLVRRETCETDRRASFAILTERGAATVRDVEPTYLAAARDVVLDHLTHAQAEALADAIGALLPNACHPAPRAAEGE